MSLNGLSAQHVPSFKGFHSVVRNRRSFSTKSMYPVTIELLVTVCKKWQALKFYDLEEITTTNLSVQLNMCIYPTHSYFPVTSE